METRSAKRKKLLDASKQRLKYNEQEEDRISDLPNDVLHHILFFLPIKSIAQTSVLSKRWRNLWYSFPDLDFTSLNILTNAASARKKMSSYCLKGAEFIDQVLGIREKHSDIRLLRIRAFLSFSRLNGLIRRAIKHNVQELDIEVSTCDYFNFPRSIITSDSLRVFRLKSWRPGFRLPPLEIMKAGFLSISNLSLSRVILHDQPSLLNLFTDSSFPLLKKLHLEACFGLKHLRIICRSLEDLALESCFQLENLEISSPKLERLRVSSCFDAYSVSSWVKIDAPALQIIFWSYNTITEESFLHNLTSLHEAFVGFFVLHEDLSGAKLQSVSNFMSGISNCRSLTLENQCIEILSKNNRFAGVLLCPFRKLESLELYTGFNKHNNPGLASLFRISPTIHTIIIKIVGDRGTERKQWNKNLWDLSSSGEERYWESQTEGLKCFLHNLKVVKIHGFAEYANDISLVKFLLKNGKVLQELFLCTSLSKPRDSLFREKIRSQIMGFSRASSSAKIVFQ
ncbi:putative F-box/FBD/LRR-repeat protein [Forsythia ovata]|uniref:F-box/FBD/LRR-repeat protein n=1 Tax=Forsythia ovata TaxID=205694 RepID=A0ABD1S916_9LAMI